MPFTIHVLWKNFHGAWHYDTQLRRTAQQWQHSLSTPPRPGILPHRRPCWAPRCMAEMLDYLSKLRQIQLQGWAQRILSTASPWEMQGQLCAIGKNYSNKSVAAYWQAWPDLPRMHNNKKVSMSKIPITWRKSRTGVLCSEEIMLFIFHFYFVLLGLLNHTQLFSIMSDTTTPPFRQRIHSTTSNSPGLP